MDSITKLTQEEKELLKIVETKIRREKIIPDECSAIFSSDGRTFEICFFLNKKPYSILSFNGTKEIYTPYQFSF